MKKILIIGLVVVLVIVGLAYKFKKKPQPPAQHGVPVLVGKTVQKAMPLIIETIGTIEAYKSITVFSRVMGQLVQIHFKEGQDVRKGDMLFTIDPNPYREKLRAAEAKLAQDTAQLKYNESEAKRYAYLFEKGAVSKSDYENKQTLAGTQEAIVRADKAEADNARLNLEYCFIRSPLEGRAGAYVVQQGTMVKDNDTKLVVINQITPIYAKFSVPEKQLAQIRDYMKSGALVVKVYPSGIKDKSVEGILTFIDNTVDVSTGMIMLKATFDNKDKQLWPGQFVNVLLQLAYQQNAIVVPSKAVQISQSGSYVYVVKPDKKVEYRNVIVDRTIGEEAVISKGLSPNEIVVTDGQLKLKDGFPVDIRDSLVKKPNDTQKKPEGTGNTKTPGSSDNKK